MSAGSITRRLLRADGTLQDLPTRVGMEAIRDMVGTDCLSTVTLKHMGRPLHVMLLDDLSDSKGLPVNEAACALYWANCVPRTTHPIRGNVVVVPDEDFAP